jgi:murein DD-endopeptidase MepM/ murein hydrolase activator NlpD
MNRRKIRNYTIWIARTGREPIVLSLRPLVLLLVAGLPITLMGAVTFFFIQHNKQLSQRNSQLTEEAGSILEQVEALESTLTNLQERANISQDDSDRDDLDNPASGNSQVDPDSEDNLEQGDLDRLDELDAVSGTEPGGENRRNFEEQPIDSVDEAYGNRNRTSNYYQTRHAPGGKGGAIGAESLLAAAKAKLPVLVRELEGKVEPALQEIIVREEAKPSGVPLRAKAIEVTSGFGFRSNPFGWGYEFHQGIDFVAAYGSPIYATASGTVTKAEWEPGYGNHVMVDHGYGLETLYAHLSDIKVNQGDRVSRHRMIGELGNTGRSSGPHLHYSVFRNGQPVDPKKYLD